MARISGFTVCALIVAVVLVSLAAGADKKAKTAVKKGAASPKGSPKGSPAKAKTAAKKGAASAKGSPKGSPAKGSPAKGSPAKANTVGKKDAKAGKSPAGKAPTKANTVGKKDAKKDAAKPAKSSPASPKPAAAAPVAAPAPAPQAEEEFAPLERRHTTRADRLEGGFDNDEEVDALSSELRGYDLSEQQDRYESHADDFGGVSASAERNSAENDDELD